MKPGDFVKGLFSKTGRPFFATVKQCQGDSCDVVLKSGLELNVKADRLVHARRDIGETEMQWFILRVKSTRERSVIRALSDKRLRGAFFGDRPKDERGNALNEDCLVDFAGYVIVEMPRIGDSLHWHLIDNIPDIYSLVGQFAGLDVARLSSGFIERRMKHVTLKEGGSEYVVFLSRQEKQKLVEAIKFLKGETVRVKSGPATGICGTVQEDTEEAVCIDFGNYALNVDQTLVERVESAA